MSCDTQPGSSVQSDPAGIQLASAEQGTSNNKNKIVESKLILFKCNGNQKITFKILMVLALAPNFKTSSAVQRSLWYTVDLYSSAHALRGVFKVSAKT